MDRIKKNNQYHSLTELTDILDRLSTIWNIDNTDQMQHEIDNLIFDINFIKKQNYHMCKNKLKLK